MGADAEYHDMMMFNRQTAAILTATLVMVAPGDTVIGASPTYSHPCVTRAVERAGAKFVDTVGVTAFSAAFDAAHAAGETVSVVALTRLAVSYEIMAERDIEKIIAIARSAGAKILVDDAGGARVGPAVFNQPKSLEFDVDIASTGLDKYGTIGPRLGLLAGDAQLVADIRAFPHSTSLGISCPILMVRNQRLRMRHRRSLDRWLIVRSCLMKWL